MQYDFTTLWPNFIMPEFHHACLRFGTVTHAATRRKFDAHHAIIPLSVYAASENSMTVHVRTMSHALNRSPKPASGVVLQHRNTALSYCLL